VEDDRDHVPVARVNYGLTRSVAVVPSALR